MAQPAPDKGGAPRASRPSLPRDGRPIASQPLGEKKLETREPDPLIGRVIADRYRIVGHLGRGGMGVVYKVEHLRIGKLMAMKLLTGELSRNKDVVRRFKREALAASRLTSINTVQVWDFGHSDGLTYLVMELVAGEDLGRILKREGPMPFHRVAQIAVQVCNSMMEAHDRGIVHRDIKPENILLVHPGGHGRGPDARSERGVSDLVKVLDFGLAKLHDDERPHTNEVTTTGAIVGTPFYMAPEQIRGEPVDGRADIYALGAVMYRAITGVPPFTASTPMAVLTQHLTERLVPPHERAPELGIPREAAEIIARAMAKDRDARYGSAVELRDALIAYLVACGVSSGFLRNAALETSPDSLALDRIRPSRGDTDVVAPATRREVARWWRSRRRKIGYGLAATAALTLAGIVILSVHEKHRPAPTGVEAEPNDTIGQANAITLGAPVRGHIGKRLGPDRPDVDWFRFEVPQAHADTLLDLALAPLPNFGLCATLHGDPSGEHPVASFCRPRGQALAVSAFRVAPGPYWIEVTEDRGPTGSEPVFENVSDTYALRVALASATSDLEIEPNDALGSAQALEAGTRVVGRIGWRGDRDAFCTRASGLSVSATSGSLEAQSFVDGKLVGAKKLSAGEALGSSGNAGLRCVVVHAAVDAVDAPYEVTAAKR